MATEHFNADQIEQARRGAHAFHEAFGTAAAFAATAPGRVNLIGEHTDYNAGLVLPLAIERQSLLLATPRHDTTIRLRSTALPGEAILDLHSGIGPGAPAWSNYLRGVIARWLEAHELSAGFDALLDSTVPTGGGLSSSASITIAMATLLEALTATQIEPIDKALMAQWAEHEYVGTPCGLMDQLASTMGTAGHALLIDCQSNTSKAVTVPDELAIIITNSNKPHELVGGEYAQRRAQCDSAAKKLGVDTLRDATLQMLIENEDKLDAIEFKRSRHVITENARVLAMATALGKRDWPTVGMSMYDSHASMRDDFEITTPELNTLVDLAAAIGPEGGASNCGGGGDSGGGVIGSRMTGGGFGGCTVTLAHAQHADAVCEQLAQGYRSATGIHATIFTTRPAQGARILDLAELLA